MDRKDKIETIIAWIICALISLYLLMAGPAMMCFWIEYTHTDSVIECITIDIIYAFFKGLFWPFFIF